MGKGRQVADLSEERSTVELSWNQGFTKHVLTSITLTGYQALGGSVLFLITITCIVPCFSCVAMERLKAKG